MDRLAGHHRRYTRKGLAATLVSTGFRIERLEYFNLLGFFGWFVTGRLLRPRDLRDPGLATQIRLFDRLVPALNRIEARVRLPFGQSLLAVAERTERPSC